MVLELQSRLPTESRQDLLNLFEVVGTSLPTDALFADLGGDVESVVTTATTEQALIYAVQTMYHHLSSMDKGFDEILTMMKGAEPFRSNWERTEEISKMLMKETKSGGADE